MKTRRVWSILSWAPVAYCFFNYGYTIKRVSGRSMQVRPLSYSVTAQLKGVHVYGQVSLLSILNRVSRVTSSSSTVSPSLWAQTSNAVTSLLSGLPHASFTQQKKGSHSLLQVPYETRCVCRKARHRSPW